MSQSDDAQEVEIQVEDEEPLPFSQVPNLFWDEHARRLSDPEMVVYLLLKRFAGRKGEAWPRLGTMGERLGKGVSTIRRAMSGLESKGYLVRIPRPGTANAIRLVALSNVPTTTTIARKTPPENERPPRPIPSGVPRPKMSGPPPENERGTPPNSERPPAQIRADMKKNTKKTMVKKNDEEDGASSSSGADELKEFAAKLHQQDERTPGYLKAFESVCRVTKNRHWRTKSPFLRRDLAQYARELFKAEGSETCDKLAIFERRYPLSPARDSTSNDAIPVNLKILRNHFERVTGDDWEERTTTALQTVGGNGHVRESYADRQLRESEDQSRFLADFEAALETDAYPATDA